MTPAIQSTPPIEYPMVTIGGITVTVKFSFQASYMLSKWGLDPQVVLGSLSNRDENGQPRKGPMPPEFIARIVDLFSACVAHNYTSLGQPAPTPDFWASAMQMADFKDVIEAITEAMGKVSPAKTQMAPTTLAATPGPVQ